jgi:transposase-like protein
MHVGIVCANFSLWNMLVWMVAETAQIGRIMREERLLSHEPAYARYVQRVRWRLVPGQLLTFFDFPAEHWRHLRTTNIIESPFATVRLRQRVTKGAGSRTKALMMAFKLLAMAEERWRKVNGSELLPLVRAGVRFVDGVQETPKTTKGERKENAA